MATLNMLFSYTIEDADGNTRAFPVYATVSDGATLADINTAMVAIGTDLNAIIDGVIRKVAYTILGTVDGGWRTTPVAGSNVQETGLITYPLISVPGKHYSEDIPAFYQSGFTGKLVNLAATNVVTWTDRATGGGATPFTNDQWSSELDTPTKGKKTFRKHK